MQNKHDAPLIRIENLSKVYRPQGGGHEAEVRALDGVSLDIQRGEFVSIMGPSGSGKSTLMQVLGLLDRATGGNYYLDGQDVALLNDDEISAYRCKKIGFIFQFYNLLARTTCEDNVRLPMLYAGDQSEPGRPAKLLAQVGLGNRLKHKPHQLSGGQQQRVAIARALINKPDLIFADEPTGNISSEQTEEILQHLESLNAEGVTIVLVTHELEVAHKARRLITVRDGKIAADELLRERVPPVLNVDDARSASGNEVGNTQSTDSTKRRLSPVQERVLENIKMAWVALSLNKLRTSLATLGVIIGIASVVAMVAIGQGAQNAVAEQLASLGTNLLNIRPINPKSSKGAIEPQRRFEVDDYQALEGLKSRNFAIGKVDAQVYGQVVVASGPNNAQTDLVGATVSAKDMQAFEPTEGRFFTADENEQKARVVLIGQTVARNLFADKNPLGATIKVNRIDFTVIGILPPKGATAFKDRDDQIMMPLMTAMFRVLGRRTLHALSVEVTDQLYVAQAIDDIKAFLRERRNLKPDQVDDFEVRDMNDIREIYSQTTGIISSMLAAIAAVSLLVGGIGIMNVMLVAVKERTREVGLRKALGARKKDIQVQFIIESMLIGLLGGGLGVIAGIGLARLTSVLMGWPTLISFSMIVVSFLFSLFVGVVFGLWPAKQASELSPIEALRYE